MTASALIRFLIILMSVTIISSPGVAQDETAHTRALRIHFAESQDWRPVQFERFHNAIFFDALIGGMPAVVALDNGSEATLIDAGFAKRAGISASGPGPELHTGTATHPTSLARNVTLAIADHLTVSGDLALYDLAPLSSVIGHPVDAVLGGDVLNSLAVVLLPRRHILSLVKSGSYQVNAKAINVPLTTEGKVAATLNGVPLQLQLDLGSNNVVTLGPLMWERAVSEDASLRAGRSTRLEGAAQTTRLAQGNRLNIGGFEVDNVPVTESGPLPQGFEGLLGGGFFARFDTVIDFPKKNVALIPLRSPQDGAATSSELSDR